MGDDGAVMELLLEMMNCMEGSSSSSDSSSGSDSSSSSDSSSGSDDGSGGGGRDSDGGGCESLVQVAASQHVTADTITRQESADLSDSWRLPPPPQDESYGGRFPFCDRLSGALLSLSPPPPPVCIQPEATPATPVLVDQWASVGAASVRWQHLQLCRRLALVTAHKLMALDEAERQQRADRCLRRHVLLHNMAAALPAAVTCSLIAMTTTTTKSTTTTVVTTQRTGNDSSGGGGGGGGGGSGGGGGGDSGGGGGGGSGDNEQSKQRHKQRHRLSHRSQQQQQQQQRWQRRCWSMDEAETATSIAESETSAIPLMPCIAEPETSVASLAPSIADVCNRQCSELGSADRAANERRFLRRRRRQQQQQQRRRRPFDESEDCCLADHDHDQDQDLCSLLQLDTELEQLPAELCRAPRSKRLCLSSRSCQQVALVAPAFSDMCQSSCRQWLFSTE